MKRAALITAVVALGTTLNACVSVHSYKSMGYGPPRPLCCRVTGEAPGPEYVWTEGYWNPRDGRWEWVEGRWEVPPRTGAVWVPGTWTESPRGNWVFQPGHWR